MSPLNPLDRATDLQAVWHCVQHSASFENWTGIGAPIHGHFRAKNKNQAPTQFTCMALPTWWHWLLKLLQAGVSAFSEKLAINTTRGLGCLRHRVAHAELQVTHGEQPVILERDSHTVVSDCGAQPPLPAGEQALVLFWPTSTTSPGRFTV